MLLFQVTEDEFLRLQALYMARIEELELKVLLRSFMVIIIVEVGRLLFLYYRVTVLLLSQKNFFLFSVKFVKSNIGTV